MKAAEIGVPPRLRAIPDPPSRLWLRGHLPDAPAVAIVGTRRCTAYGRRIATDMGRAVGASGRVVVSGLARGVDAAAHRGVVEGCGVGVGVLGSALDVLYPAENRGLAERLIADGGGILSEYPPGTPPAPFRFPARNRLIAGLSDVVVVVEAAVTGGALITARIALEQGKDVLAVPGDIDREVSAGCNLLIRDGAHPVLGIGDLLELLDFIIGPAPRPGGLEHHLDTAPSLEEEMSDTGRSVAEVLAGRARAEIARAKKG